MTETIDILIQARFDAVANPSDDRDWDDVVARARTAEQPVGCARPARRWRVVLVTAVVVAGIVGVGLAIAAGFGAFNGISAAQHPQTAVDIPPEVASLIARTNKQLARYEARLHSNKLGLLEPDSSRFISELPDGARVWVVATTTGQLCAVIEGIPGGSANPHGVGGLGCARPLSRELPTTAETDQPDSSLPPLSWGVTLDSVTAVSFMAGRHEVTVPVKNNVWTYLGQNAALNSLTVHLADGTTKTINHGSGH